MNERLWAIQALVQHALETSIKDPGSKFVDVARAVKLHPGVTTLAELDYFWDEYSIQIGLEPRMKYLAQLLESIKPLNLSSAPEVIGVLPAGKDHSVLVTRYKVEPGEQLYPIKATCIMPSPEAQARLVEDMRILASHSQIHTYARGFFHWFISSKTHRLVLNAWSSFRDCPQTEANQMIERVEGVMDGIKEEHSWNRIRQTFGLSRVLLPVIHPVSWEQALASTQIAVDAGVKGIFLINQGLDVEDVLRLVLEVRRRHPSLWVGINLLGYSPAQALEAALEACEGRIDGIWADNASIEEDAAEQPRPRAFLEARKRLGWNGLYFGGVAFKYQREVSAEKLPAATRLASEYMDVICTSGPGTGHQADPQKVATMRAAVGPSSSIALASGVTAENVAHYLPYVNAYLVGTGIERSFGVLDPIRVAALQSVLSG